MSHASTASSAVAPRLLGSSSAHADVHFSASMSRVSSALCDINSSSMCLLGSSAQADVNCFSSMSAMQIGHDTLQFSAVISRFDICSL